MKVRIWAIARGTTALRSGVIIHLDPAATNNPDFLARDDIEIEDARRLKDRGWADFHDPEAPDADKVDPTTGEAGAKAKPAAGAGSTPIGYQRPDGLDKPGDVLQIGEYAVEKKDGGWFHITGPRLEKAKSIRGEVAARQAAVDMNVELAALIGGEAQQGPGETGEAQQEGEGKGEGAHDPEAGPAA